MELEILEQYGWLILLVVLWSLPWKGVALWKAARLGDKLWFVVLLVVNTVGLLEIYYIYFGRRQPRDNIPPSQPTIQ